MHPRWHRRRSLAPAVAGAVLLVLVIAIPPVPQEALSYGRSTASGALGLSARAAGPIQLHPFEVPGPSSGAPNATWQSSLVQGPLSGRTGAALAWDPRDGYLVLFGGSGPQGATNSTWTFAAGGWTNRTNASNAPPAVAGASMDFDYALHAIVLFGGCGPLACPSSSTWLYDGGIWLNVTNRSIAQPPARFDASMGFENDSTDPASVLFGGCLASDCSRRANDTWQLNTTLGWVPGAPSSSPSPTSGASFTYDPSLAGLVLFGGCGGPACGGTNATWLYTDGTWSALGSSIPRPFPPADPAPAATFDAGTNRLYVVTGSVGGAGVPWALSCAGSCRWANQSSTVGPGILLPSEGAVMAAESGTIPPVLVGAASNSSSNATPAWVLEPSLSLQASLLPPVAPARSTVQGSSEAAGGTSPYRFLWTVGTEESSAQNVSLVFASPGLYQLSVVVSDAYGVEARVALTERSTGPSVAATASPGTVDEGIPVQFVTLPPTGGTPPYNVTWQWPDGTDSFGAAVSHGFSILGPQSVGVLVTDARGVTNQSSLTILVVARPTVAIESPRNATDPGGAVNLSAVVEGGVLPFSYLWTFSGGPSNETGPMVAPQFGTPGVYPVRLQVTDQVGAVAVAVANVTVSPALGARVEAASSSGGWGPPSSIVNGTTLELRTVPTNGTPNYTIQWEVRTPAPTRSLQFNGTWLNLTADALGTYEGVAVVTDATGASFNASFEVQSVAPPPSYCGSCGSNPDLVWEFVVAAVLVLAGVAGVAAALAVRRQDRDP